MSGRNIHNPGKRILRSNSLIAGSTKQINMGKVPAKRKLRSKSTTPNKVAAHNSGTKQKSYEPSKTREQTTSRMQIKENLIPVKCGSSCALTETVHHLALQNSNQSNELVLANKQLAQMQNKYINALEVQFIRDEKVRKYQKQMKNKIALLKSEIEKHQTENSVQNLIDFDDEDGVNTGNRTFSTFY